MDVCPEELAMVMEVELSMSAVFIQNLTKPALTKQQEACRPRDRLQKNYPNFFDWLAPIRLGAAANESDIGLGIPDLISHL